MLIIEGERERVALTAHSWPLIRGYTVQKDGITRVCKILSPSENKRKRAFRYLLSNVHFFHGNGFSSFESSADLNQMHHN